MKENKIERPRTIANSVVLKLGFPKAKRTDAARQTDHWLSHAPVSEVPKRKVEDGSLNTDAKTGALDALACYLDELRGRPPSDLIYGATFKAYDLGLDRRDAHMEITKYFRNRRKRQCAWSTAKTVTSAWKRAQTIKGKVH